MNEQFVVPDHPPIPVVPYSKEYFMSLKRNLLIEQKAMDTHHPLLGYLSKDLFSNLGSAPESLLFSSAPNRTISKEFTFAAAHALPYHKGKCQFLHGHEWKLKVSITGPVNVEGMVIDFAVLKDVVNKVVIDKMDHAYINALLFNPTAENLCVYIWNLLQYEGNLKGISKIVLWETPTSHAILTAAEMGKTVKGMWDWPVAEDVVNVDDIY